MIRKKSVTLSRLYSTLRVSWNKCNDRPRSVVCVVWATAVAKALSVPISVMSDARLLYCLRHEWLDSRPSSLLLGPSSSVGPDYTSESARLAAGTKANDCEFKIVYAWVCHKKCWEQNNGCKCQRWGDQLSEVSSSSGLRPEGAKSGGGRAVTGRRGPRVSQIVRMTVQGLVKVKYDYPM